MTVIIEETKMARRNGNAGADKLQAHNIRNAQIDALAKTVKTVGEKGASMQSQVFEALKEDDSIILRAAERAVAYFESLNVDTAERQVRKHAALSVLRVQLKRAFKRLDGTGIEPRSLKVDKAGVASWAEPRAKAESEGKTGEPPTAENAAEALAYLSAVIGKMVEQTFLTEQQAASMLAIAHGEQAVAPKRERLRRAA